MFQTARHSQSDHHHRYLFWLDLCQYTAPPYQAVHLHRYQGNCPIHHTESIRLHLPFQTTDGTNTVPRCNHLGRSAQDTRRLSGQCN